MHRGVSHFASAEDHRVCRALHRQHGTTYYFASRHFPAHVRRSVDALYAFVRVPDEWVDNPTTTPEITRERLDDYRRQLELSQHGYRPSHPALRAFADVLSHGKVPLSEAQCFLDAMVLDLTTDRYATYADLEGYMRGSAAAVGLMMARLTGAPDTPETDHAARALGNAMQMTNFIRDVGEDWRDRGRIYLPLEDLGRFGVTTEDIAEGRVSEAWRDLLRFEIERTRQLYQVADSGIPLLPPMARRPVRLARTLYAQILDKVEENDYDVFSQRARTTRWEKISALISRR